LANFIILKRIKAALGLDYVRTFAYGAAPLKQSSVQYFASLDMPLFNYYGLTETTGGTTGMNLSSFSLTSTGYATPGSELRIDNPNEN